MNQAKAMVKRHVKSDSPNDLTLSRLIESDEFAFEFLSTLAERESWRKEIYRPVYHVHKWWAKRLGSVFRGILLGCLLPEGGNLSKAFYERHDFSHVVVFDPFMGSGTTIGEAQTWLCRAGPRHQPGGLRKRAWLSAQWTETP